MIFCAHSILKIYNCRRGVIMAKKTTKARLTYDLPRLLQQHLRWVIVLAKLRELDRGGAHVGVVKRLSEFPPVLIDAIMNRSALNSSQFTKKDWDSWFAARSGSPVSSIYECRGFYGLDSPNNLVQRFERAVRESEGDERPAARTGRSAYEEAINEWGDYALALVRANGGPRHFFQLDSLERVIDIQPDNESKTLAWRGGHHADVETSFVRRILSLDADRYVQILLPAVGVLWPLWFLKLDRTDILLRETADERLLGPQLSLDSIPYIDLVTTIGQCAGLPYPFGTADKALRQHADENGTTVETNAPWSSQAMMVVADAFSKARWSPPVLLSGRGDQWSVHEQPGRMNKIVPIAAVSEASPIFGSLYVSRRRSRLKANKYRSAKVAYEAKTWGERFVQRLKLEASAVRLSRGEFINVRRHPSEYDLILSYYPLDLLLNIPSVERVTPTELAASIGVQAEEVEYILPSTILAAGALLGEQPKMRTLIINLVRVLHRAVELVHHIRPRGEVISSQLRRLRFVKTEAERKAEAVIVEQLCLAAASRAAFSAPHIHADSVPTWMKAIGKDMVETLIPALHTGERADAVHLMNEWGWAQLLEYVVTTSIYVSVELF
ncbi:MAG TPA: hypothetical protein VF701_04070 [Thermoanaerobaculia bacterium]